MEFFFYICKWAIWVQELWLNWNWIDWFHYGREIMFKMLTEWPVMSMLGGVHIHHGNFICFLPGGVRASWFVQGLCFWNSCNISYLVAKSHWAVQWFIQANQKPLLINIAVTQSIALPLWVKCQCYLHYGFEFIQNTMYFTHFYSTLSRKSRQKQLCILQVHKILMGQKLLFSTICMVPPE